MKARIDVELCTAMGDDISVDCPDAFFQHLKDDLGLSEPDSVSERKRGSHPRCLATVERYNIDAKQTAAWFEQFGVDPPPQTMHVDGCLCLLLIFPITQPLQAPWW